MMRQRTRVDERDLNTTKKPNWPVSAKAYAIIIYIH